MSDKITLDIDIADAPEYIDLIQKMRLAVDEEISKRQRELSALVTKSVQLGFMLEKLGSSPSGIPIVVDSNIIIGGNGNRQVAPVKVINGYNHKWTVWEKIQYVLRKQIEPISKIDIIKILEGLEPGLAELRGAKYRTFSVSISACLSTKSANGLLARARATNKDDYKYYLPNKEATE
ncbi:MAG TPA: hypothetical protein VGQ51_08040 [Puia sp.]|jgi:hypothetical protein|nr:hypothetical protein [Puia sp.]